MIHRELLSYLTFVKKEMVFAVLYKYLLFFLNLSTVLASAWLLERIITGKTVDSFFFGLFIFFMVCSALLRFVIHRFLSQNGFRIAKTIQTTLRKDIYNKILELELGYLESSGTSSLVSLAIEGVELLEVYFARYLPQLFYSMSVPFVLFMILANISFTASSVMLLAVPLIPLSIIFFIRRAEKSMSSFWKGYEDLAADFLESIQGLVTLKLANRDADKAAELNSDAETFRAKTMRVLRVQLSSIFFMDLFSLSGAAIGSIIALYGMKNGDVTLFGALVILLMSSEFFLPIRKLGALFHAGMNGVAAADRMFAFLRETPVCENKGTRTLSHIDKLVCTDLSFSYDHQRIVLKDVSFEVKKGEKVAVVGRSGAGKSTVAGMILNLFNTPEHTVYINGVDIHEYENESLRDNIAVVSQNTWLFNGTIRENLLIAREDATDEEIIHALKTVGLDTFVASLEKGIDTAAGEWGKRFSGGQKQRIALARAVLKKSSFLIFDEATSNVDADNEDEIWKNIFDIAEHSTALIISHRLTSIRQVDRIIVLENGAVTEAGSHDQLMSRNGLYARMYREQSQLEEAYA